MRNDMYHIQIRIKCRAIWRIVEPVIVFINMRQAVQEVRRNELVEFFKTTEKERILVLAGRGACTQCTSNVKVRHPAEQHDCLYDE